MYKSSGDSRKTENSDATDQRHAAAEAIAEVTGKRSARSHSRQP